MFRPPTDQDVETIDRKQLPKIEFYLDDVLADDAAAQKIRSAEARRAAVLANTHQTKATIFFRAADGQTKRVRAHVLAAHTEYLTLKDEMMLPLRAVLGFEV
ncbi:hypothetical protein E4631_11460 [Hymenobacter sp. UV11]|uniref:hypothetical protein n=1 Tax=Hymenobacter sp. UV11 TaxID=1849735 RepID=UPI00105EB43D|nr:hypothetical protein [Hymenobacter sp. UV11]TDN40377.1 hypothetical protein A8B98_13095 [Hymenobacter sp. UV11]TFZ66620.1 hypothetical protein E4631_11460 [Hymenobacter sp. UV11]